MVRDVARMTLFAALAIGCTNASAVESNNTAAVDLEEIVVTPTRTENPLESLPVSVDLLNAGFVRKANAISLDELFKNVPGVDLLGSGTPGSAVKLSLRGLSPGYQSKRVLVLMDGRRLNDQYQGNAEFALIPADAIARVEVLRGPASAVYGSNALGGVINIITRRGILDPLTEFYMGGGSHETLHARFSHGRRVGRADYFVSGSHVQTGGYTKNSDGTDRDWEARNITANAGIFTADGSELRLYTGAYRGEGTDENSERTACKNYQHVTYVSTWNEAREAQLLARVYRNRDDSEYDWKYPGKGIYDQETLAGEVQQTIRVAEKHRLAGGVEWRREAVDIEETAGPIDESVKVLGVFGQDEIALTDALSLTAGLRRDDDSDFGGEWSPRAGLLWRALPGADLFASVNRAYRAPGLSDRYVRTEFNGRLFVGNPELDPETLTAWEIGARARMGGWLRGEVVLFHNDLEDAFDFLMAPDGTFRIENATRESILGVEASLSCRLADGLSAFMNYSFTDGQYDEFKANPAVEGNELAYLAKNKAAAGLSYEDSGGWSCGASARYVGKRYGDAQNTGENRMNDHVLLDLRGRFALTDNLDLLLNLDNVLDEEYEHFPGIDGPGFTAMAGLEAAF